MGGEERPKGHGTLGTAQGWLNESLLIRKEVEKAEFEREDTLKQNG